MIKSKVLSQKKLFPDDQNEIKFDDKLVHFFDKAKDGCIRMIKVVITDSKILELFDYREIDTDSESDWMADYNEIVLNSVNPTCPCFILYRLDEKTVLHNLYKWILISWSPSHVSNKHRTIYALTKSSLIQKFTGGFIKRVVIATDLNELSLESYLAYQHKPSSTNDHERKIGNIEELEESEHVVSNEKHEQMESNDKSRLLSTLPMDALVFTQLDAFKHEKCAYLRFSIDINTEKILMERVITCFNVNLISNEIPLDKPRFHLFRFNHNYNNKQYKSVIFIFTIPEAAQNIKEKEIYTNYKNELLSHFKTHTGLDVTKIYEVSEITSLSKEFFIESLHDGSVVIKPINNNNIINTPLAAASFNHVQLRSSSISSTPSSSFKEEDQKMPVKETIASTTTTTTSPSTNAQTPVLSANNAIIEAISSQSDALLQKLMNMDLIYLLAFGFFFLSISLGLFKMIASRI